MAIPPGQRFGSYEIIGAIGAGGMGEVYQAHDTRLGRDVAIKVLPEAFAHDPERLSRFQREAKMLAALNHPSIAAIYGLEENAGTSYLVMEFVPGETLAERIKRGGAIPEDETLTIARQMAEALEAAHEKGIIHRDLKPANVKVTPEGKVKVLDFGLAKAFAEDGASQDLANSPTMSGAATMQGVILGTAAYMSPEQARGKAVDKRADIWAFGVVLYEMLTGEQLFAGETVSDTLAAVLRNEPDYARVPARMQRLLRWCLQKDPKKRLRDVADGLAIVEETPDQKVSPVAAKAISIWPWAIVAAACVIAAAFAFVLFRGKAASGAGGLPPHHTDPGARYLQPERRLGTVARWPSRRLSRRRYRRPHVHLGSGHGRRGSQSSSGHGPHHRFAPCFLVSRQPLRGVSQRFENPQSRCFGRHDARHLR